MSNENDLEAMRNRLKDVLRGSGSTPFKKELHKTAIPRRIGSNTVNYQEQQRQTNGKSELLKELDTLNMKLLTMERKLELQQDHALREKKLYQKNFELLNEKASKMKDKVIMANERISDLEGTLAVKNDRISALTAQLQMFKSPKSQVAHDTIDNLRRNIPQQTSNIRESKYEDDSIIDLDTRKLMELNLRTMEFEYDPSLDQTTSGFTKRTDVNYDSGGDTMDLLMRGGESKSTFKSPIYNSNPASKGLNSDDELYLKSSQFKGTFGERESFDLESALKDSTEKIAGVYC